MGSIRLLLVVACLLGGIGCRSTQTVNDGAIRLTNMGILLHLPQGQWQVQRTEDVNGRYLASDEGRHFMIFSRPIPEGLPLRVAERELMAQFEEKEELAREAITVAGGPAEYARYRVQMDDTSVLMDSCAFRHGELEYQAAEWRDSGEPELTQLLSGIEFTMAGAQEAAP